MSPINLGFFLFKAVILGQYLTTIFILAFPNKARIARCTMGGSFLTHSTVVPRRALCQSTVFFCNRVAQRNLAIRHGADYRKTVDKDYVAVH